MARPRSSGIFSGVTLMLFGVAFLLHNYRGFEFQSVLLHWWPVLLIVLGLIKLYERTSSRYEPGAFLSFRDVLLTGGDHYRHLADLASYLTADERLLRLYADHDAWTRKSILNVSGSGKFSSDRTIAEYATDIWNAVPCPVA